MAVAAAALVAGLSDQVLGLAAAQAAARAAVPAVELPQPPWMLVLGQPTTWA